MKQNHGRWLRTLVPGLGLLMVTAACGSPSQSAAKHTPPESQATSTSQVASTSSTSSTTPVPSSVPATQPSVTTTTTAQLPVPTLGHLAGSLSHGSGFGQVKPPAFSNGGDPTGAVGSVVWSSWGTPTATATGVSDYVAQGESVAQGSQESVSVVAFNLGYCAGQYMYQSVTWYFPQHGQTFSTTPSENICTG